MSESQIYTADDVDTSGFCIGVHSAVEGMRARMMSSKPSPLSLMSPAERRTVFDNLFNLDHASARDIGLQQEALRVCRRFSFAEWVNSLCAFCGWQLVGPGPLELGIDDEFVDRGFSLEWLTPGDDNRIVRLELGDEPGLWISENYGEIWRVIDWRGLVDVLAVWAEGQSVRSAA